MPSSATIDLTLGVREGDGVSVIGVYLPGIGIHHIGEYQSKEVAGKNYNEFLEQLRDGWAIRITGYSTAELYNPK